MSFLISKVRRLGAATQARASAITSGDLPSEEPWLTSNRSGSLLAAAPETPGQNAVLVTGGAALPGTSLPVIVTGALQPRNAGPDAWLSDQPPTGRVVRDLRRRAPAALVAGPMSPAGPFDGWQADVCIAPVSGAPGDSAAQAHAAAVRAAGRPLLVDIRSPATTGECIVAAVDAGACGALVRTGDASADREIVAEAAQLEASRFDDAPLVSIVICNYNNGRYLDASLGSLKHLDYPRYEVILCDDGSEDDSVAIARRHDCTVLELEHGGLSRARNAGMAAAAGEIVVFLDADAAGRPGWLSALWRLIDRTGAEAAGGPNLPFPDVGWREQAVAGAPGPPIPVVAPDGSATFVPGCNLALRRDVVDRIGEFGSKFVATYDDVDYLHRLQDAGGRIAYAARGSVLHHRRDSLRGFLRQQYDYAATETQNYRGSQREVVIPDAPRPGMLARLDPRRPRHVFSGPQGLQLFILASRPLHVELPLKALAAIAAVGCAAAPPARRAGRLDWLAGACAAALLSVLGVMAARCPGPRARDGRAAVLVRAATVGLWMAQPLARRAGRARGRPETGS